MNTPAVLRKSWPWLAAAGSGALLALCFAPWNQPLLVWIALLPLLAALWLTPADAPKWRAPLLGYCSGIVFFTAAFSWLSNLAPLFESPGLVGLPLLLAVYLALYPAAWSWLVANPPAPGRTPVATSLRNITFAIRGACAWVALDWIRGWLFSGFGWNSPGVALHNNLALIQIADLFGVHGVTFLIVFSTLSMALAIRRLKHEASFRALPNLRAEIMTVLLLVGLSVSYGVRIVVQKDPGPAFALRTVAIQPNVPQEQKFDADQEDAVFQRLDGLMQLACAIQPPPHLILWPEAATPRGMFADEANYEFTRSQAERSPAALLLGTLEPVAPGPEQPGELLDFNSVVLIQGKDAPLQSYRKRHLVPFGEFLPFRDWLPNWVRNLVPGDLTPGREANLLHLENPSVRIGALVCFEDSLARETRSLALEGAQVLVNVTNDAWFAHSAAAEQHLANSKFRAIETRLPLLRCANTGVTASVDRIGRVESKIAPFTEGIDTLEVKVLEHPRLTTYTRFGDLWLVACGIASLVLARTRLLSQRKTAEAKSST